MLPLSNSEVLGEGETKMLRWSDLVKQLRDAFISITYIH